jgi:hypothetical protein
MSPTTEPPPIACALPATDLAQRRADVAALAADALLERRPSAHGAVLTFAATASIERRLRDLIADEAECCPFLRMELRRLGAVLELDVTGPDDARPIIDELLPSAAERGARA